MKDLTTQPTKLTKQQTEMGNAFQPTKLIKQQTGMGPSFQTVKQK